MAPTPDLGGPYPGRLGLRAAGAGTGLSSVQSRGKGCLSPRLRSGNKSARWGVGGAGTQGPSREPAALAGGHCAPSRGPRRVATAPLAAVLAPGFLSPCQIPLGSATSARKQGKRVFLGPPVPEVLRTRAGRVREVQRSAPRRASAPILRPIPLDLLSYSPSALPFCSAPAHLFVCLVERTRREVKIGGAGGGGGPQVVCFHAKASAPISAPGAPPSSANGSRTRHRDPTLRLRCWSLCPPGLSSWVKPF